MKTEQVLLYAGGAFILYKLFIPPKSSVIPTQSAPIYTGQPVRSAGGSNTGSLIAFGTGLVTAISNLLNPKQSPVSAPAQGATPVAYSGSGSNDISNEISDIFGSGFSNPVAVTTNSPANNFGLPASFDSSSLDDDDD